MNIESTSVQNLIRDGDSGIFYARIKVRQKVIVRSLETDKISTAKLRLPDKLEEIRAQTNANPDVPLEYRATFAEALKIYEKEVAHDINIGDATKEFRLRMVPRLRVIWPELFDTELRRITQEDMRKFFHDFTHGKSQYLPHRARSKTIRGDSATSVNALLGFFRRVFEKGIAAGILSRNPVTGIKRKRPKKKLLELPTTKQFFVMLDHIRALSGRGRQASDLIEGLAYSGLRVGESRRICWKHLDFDRGSGWITSYGTKTHSAPRVLPMTPAFRELAIRMREQRGGSPDLESRFFEINQAYGSLASASIAVFGKKLTHKDCRDLFATTVIESGVDVPTLSKWMGHSDGGVLAMATYGHIRDKHSDTAVKKVKFE